MIASLLLSLGLVSTDPANAPAPPAVPETSPAPRQVDLPRRSLVVLPEQVGRFTLGESALDANDVRAGVRAEYHASASRGAPDITVRLVPAGAQIEARALERLASDFEAELRERSGLHDVEAGARKELWLDLPVATLYARTNGYHTRGFHVPAARWQSFEAVGEDGERVRIAGLHTHRTLFDITVRVSAPATSMPADEFEALAVEVAKTLVPRLDIRNFGDCPGAPREDNCSPGDTARHAAPVEGREHLLVY